MVELVQLGLLSVAVVSVFAAAGILYARGRVRSVEDYIVARNTTGTTRAAWAFSAAVLGVWVLFSPAESATWGGLAAIVGYGVGQAAPLLAYILLGERVKRLIPRGHSITEFAFIRYGRAMHALVLAVTSFYLFIFLVAELTGIALAFKILLDVPLYLTASVVCLAVVLYASYGGLRASIFTDLIQGSITMAFIPAVLTWALVAGGGLGRVLEGLRATSPHLADIGYLPGVEFAIFVTIAILSANLFHQGYWQFIHSCKDSRTIRRGFFASGAIAFTVVFLAGMLGLVAIGLGAVQAGEESVILFSLISRTFPEPAIMLVVVLSLALVTSSIDILFNAFSSLLAVDLARLRRRSARSILRLAKLTVGLLALPAILIASQGYSVLLIFLVADLVASAAVMPLYAGLFSERVTPRAAFAGVVVGLAASAPPFTLAVAVGSLSVGGVALGFTSLLLLSFLVAFFTPLAVILPFRAKRAGFDLGRLTEAVRPLD